MSIETQVAFALAHPVFVPERDMRLEHTQPFTNGLMVGLTVNIGME